MLRAAPDSLPESLKQVVDYRKSGLSLNHVVGCPLDCGYCVRHLFSNFEMKRPHLVVSTEDAVAQLIGHWAFVPDITPIQVFNRATDPFLPLVKDELFATLEALDALQLRNNVLVITRWKIEPTDIERLERLRSLRLTILVTWSGIDDAKLEPVDSAIAEASLVVLNKTTQRTRSVLYWRPLIVGINDGPREMLRAAELSKLADATVFTGLFLRDEIQDYLKSAGVNDLYKATARRKILPRELEARVLDAFEGRPIFRKTSCAVAYAHGISDYNGHFGLADVCDICPALQQSVCKRAYTIPDAELVRLLAEKAQLDVSKIEIACDRIYVSDSEEQQRYFLQHALNFQVHDRDKPHFAGRHGRAEVGWE